MNPQEQLKYELSENERWLLLQIEKIREQNLWLKEHYFEMISINKALIKRLKDKESEI
tara:strand:- start:1594 stop:1767 length:174 start_codon:yes stop_codon:yes gene_type:complete